MLLVDYFADVCSSPLLTFVGVRVYKMLVKLHVCSEERHGDLGASSAIKLPIPGLPFNMVQASFIDSTSYAGSSVTDAERRR